jgi:hypothetical protein
MKASWRVSWLVLCALLLPSQTTNSALPELEALAWDFRFGSDRAEPLVGALERLQARLMTDDNWLTGTLCKDECGPVERIRLWGTRNDAGLLLVVGALYPPTPRLSAGVPSPCIIVPHPPMLPPRHAPICVALQSPTPGCGHTTIP